MSLVLKMKLQTKTIGCINAEGAVSIGYQLFPVSGEENKPWSKWTPGGQLQFTVSNPDCPELEPGEYLVTLTKV